MRYCFWSLGMPLEAGDFRALAKTAGGADFFLGVVRDLPTPPAGDVRELVHLTH
jgi:hypothetical protein